MLEQLYTVSQELIYLKNQAYRRYFFHEAMMFEHRLSILSGQRGIGKTTALVQKLLEHVNGDRMDPKILYIQADHFVMGNLSLYEIAEQFKSLNGELLAIDEIHKYPNWSLELKSIYDTFPQIKILASGSSALEIMKGSHDLTRRALVHHIDGCSFREYCEMKLNIQLPQYVLNDLLNDHNRIANTIIDELRKQKQSLLLLFKEYVKIGYYPYSYEIPNPALFHITLEKNIHVTIESDLVAIHPNLSGVSVRKIELLLSYIAQSVPFIPNWKKIKSIIDVGDERTVKTYFNYLQQAGLIRLITKDTSKMSKLESSEKVYLNNTNLIYAIALGQEDLGSIRETVFASMVGCKHQLSTTGQGDFCIDQDVIIEIGGRNKDFSQIKSLKNAYLVIDDLEVGFDRKIPLWLFGFLY